jgi:hypothetical protein
LRLTQRNQPIRLVKQLRVKHLKKWTPRALWRNDIFQRALPWSRLILETGKVPRDLNLAWASRASASLVATLVLLAGRFALSFTGFPVRRMPLLLSFLAIDIFLLLLLNRDLYRFFLQKRGVTFAAEAIAAHWLYLFYSGAIFALCYSARIFRNRISPVES